MQLLPPKDSCHRNDANHPTEHLAVSELQSPAIGVSELNIISSINEFSSLWNYEVFGQEGW